MAEVGNFGKELVFQVSSKKMLSFHGFSQKISGKWSAHQMISGKVQKEYNGPGERKISLKIILDASCGVRPRKTMEKIEEMVENGTVEYLVIGGKRIGAGRFYIAEVSEAWDVIYNGGELAKATLALTLEEYS